VDGGLEATRRGKSGETLRSEGGEHQEEVSRGEGVAAYRKVRSCKGKKKPIEG